MDLSSMNDIYSKVDMSPFGKPSLDNFYASNNYFMIIFPLVPGILLKSD